MPAASFEELYEWVRGRFFGKYRGTVTDNADPSQRGRVKVRVPAVLGDVEAWAMPCVPYAGAGVGFYAIPEPGTGVWVEFEAGDPSFPIWTGCFWASGELPDLPDASVKIWRTEKLTLRLDDGADELRAESTTGSKVTISATVLSKSGDSSHEVGGGYVVSTTMSGTAELGPATFTVNNGALEVS